MANFSPTQFGFANAINQRRNIRNNRQAQEEQARIERDKMAAEAQQNYLESRNDLVERTITQLDEISTAASDAIKSGRANDDQVQAFRTAAQTVHEATLNTLLMDLARAQQSPDTPPELLSELQGMAQGLASQYATFETALQSADTQGPNPEERGAEAARERMAEVRSLAQELGLPEEKVAEGLGILPNQPAPTELEKIERSLALMDAQGIAEDDPVRIRTLNRLTQITTPSIADIIAPLIQKMRNGEELNQYEQAALDAAQRASFQDILFRSILGGGAGTGGTPTYDPNSGELR